MKKIKIATLALATMLILAACDSSESVEPAEDEAEMEYIEIPESYSICASGSVESAYESLAEFDETYCTEVSLEDETIILSVTEEQRQNLLTYYGDALEESLASFTESNENYRYNISEDEREVKVYYDESITPLTQAKILAMVPMHYGLKQLLEDQVGEEWAVTVEIYNCHTDKLVATYEVPFGETSFGEEEWTASYEED